MKKIVSTLLIVILMPLCACSPVHINSDSVNSSSENIYSSQSSQMVNSHLVTFDSNGGSFVENQTIIHGEKIKKPLDPTRTGYTFVEWTYQGEEWSFIGYTVTENTTLVANWEANNYALVISNSDTSRGSVSGAGTYAYDTEVTVIATPAIGYSFAGWYDLNNKLVSNKSTYTFKMGLDLSLVANWIANKNGLSITSEDTSKGTVSIISGSGYSGEQITITATPTSDCVFKGWYHESTKVSSDATFTFTMPTNDYSLVAYFFTKAEERYAARPFLSDNGKTISYGLYPQKNVNDSSLILALNELTAPESNGWYLYEGDYYAKVSATPYGSSYEFDNGTKISSGTTYWFECEPIVWNVLSNNDGERYIVSSVLLDAHCYSPFVSSRIVDEQTVYPNNYKHSDIRAWLNADFYNSAFALGNSHIQTTTVDNSAATTDSRSNSYACANTEDKVFLPSYKDYINSSYGFPTSTNQADNTSRYCKTTDWARARGAYYYIKGQSSQYYDSCQYNGFYWTRSPYYISSKEAWRVGYGGSLTYSDPSLLDQRGVGFKHYCVRPALSIKIA